MKRNSDIILTEWLVINSQMGDANALQQLATFWYPKLQGYAIRLVEDEQLARDVVQDTLLSMCKNIGSIKDPVCFPRWLYRMLQNKCADAIGLNQRHQRIQQTLNMSAENSASQPSQSPQFDLSDLDSESQQLVYLHYFDGFSLADISHILDLPKGTLKSRLFAIRQQLKKLLEGVQNE